MTRVARLRRRATPLLRRLPDWRALLAGVAVALLIDAIGLSTVDAVLLGLMITVVVMVLLALDGGEGYEWPADDLEQVDGTRREISALTWSFIGREGRVSENAVKQLQEVAGHRLARHGAFVPGGLRSVDVRLVAAEEAATVLRDDGSPDPEAVAVRDALRDATARAEAAVGPRAWRTLTGRGLLPSLGDIAHSVDVLDRLGHPQPPTTTTAAPDRTTERLP